MITKDNFQKIFGVFLLFSSSTLSFANATFAGKEKGGIYLTQTDTVVMLKQVLYISSNKVRVLYQFQNESDQEITSLVAFPFPVQDPGTADLRLFSDNPATAMRSKLWVNGKRVPTSHQIRAFLETDKKSKIDITAELQQFQVPLIGTSDVDIAAEVQKLSQPQRQQLIEKKIMGEHSEPLWVISPTFYWKQQFLAHQIITIKYEYEPFHPPLGIPLDLDHFCIDSPTMKTISHQDIFSHPDVNHINYILKTGVRWKGPIRSFHLILEKKKPSQIISLCLPELELKKTSPTTFEAWKTNFTPKQDLDVLFF